MHFNFLSLHIALQLFGANGKRLKIVLVFVLLVKWSLELLVLSRRYQRTARFVIRPLFTEDTTTTALWLILCKFCVALRCVLCEWDLNLNWRFTRTMLLQGMERKCWSAIQKCRQEKETGALPQRFWAALLKGERPVWVTLSLLHCGGSWMVARPRLW